MIVRFNINPALRSCRWSCFSNTSQIADAAERLVNSYSFNLTDIGSRTLYVDQLPAFYSWTGQYIIICWLSYKIMAIGNGESFLECFVMIGLAVKSIHASRL